MGPDLVTNALGDLDEQKRGFALIEKLIFKDFCLYLMFPSLRLMFIGRLFDDDHAIGVVFVVHDGIGDRFSFRRWQWIFIHKRSDVSIYLCEIIFVNFSS